MPRRNKSFAIFIDLPSDKPSCDLGYLPSLVLPGQNERGDSLGMRIYIPTRGRASQQITLRSLPDGLRPNIALVVDEAEYDEHKSYADQAEIIPVPAQWCNGIGRKRQFIVDQHDVSKYGPKLVMADDDLRFYRRRKDNPTRFAHGTSDDVVAIFQQLDSLLNDYVHVSLMNRNGANRVTAPLVEISRPSGVLAYDVRVLRRHDARFDRVAVMEDFDVCLQLLRLGYKNCVLGRYIHHPGPSNSAGGCSTYRTLQLQAQGAKKLAALHTPFVRVVTKKTKAAWGGGERTDVNVQWKQAYESSRATASGGASHLQHVLGSADRVMVVDIAEFDDPDMGLARMYYEHLMYGGPVTAELKAIMDNNEKLQEFLETNGLSNEDAKTTAMTTKTGLRIDEIVIKQAEEDTCADRNVLQVLPQSPIDPEVDGNPTSREKSDLDLDQSKPNERLIRTLKNEIRALHNAWKWHDRHARFEMGKRLAALQAERAKAKVGTFTTVDLPELKIRTHTAYRLVNFYKKVQARLDAQLLQFAKAQERFPVEDVADYDKRMADEEREELKRIIDSEAKNVDEIKVQTSKEVPDYRVCLIFRSQTQRERFKKKWLVIPDSRRSKLIYTAVMKWSK